MNIAYELAEKIIRYALFFFGEKQSEYGICRLTTADEYGKCNRNITRK